MGYKYIIPPQKNKHTVHKATIPKNLTKLRDCRTFAPERSFADAQDDITYTLPSSLLSMVRILFNEVISVKRVSWSSTDAVSSSFVFCFKRSSSRRH